MEQSISREHNLVITVLHEIADTVLCVAGCVEGLDIDAANLELLSVGRGPGYFLTVFTSDDLEGRASKVGELFGIVSTCSGRFYSCGLGPSTGRAYQLFISTGVVPMT